MPPTPFTLNTIVGHRLCMGCGGCEYICGAGAVELRNFIDEGIRPVVDASRCTDCGECVEVCPGWNLEHDRRQWPEGTLAALAPAWGPVLQLWEGHAADPEIRFRGGSGGVATALGVYGLECRGMRGVLHVAMDPERPHLNRTLLSTSRDELLAGAGSRYAPAAVAAELKAIERANGECAMIAKPCDIAAARKAARMRPELARNLGLTVAVFCGGTPSTRGTLALLKELGVDDPEEIASLRYRGHGWPGATGVNLRTDPQGRLEMTYHQAWDQILTRYKPLRCHMCPDGTGEFADIACGDPWYRPAVAGDPGSTLIVVRTEVGRAILADAIDRGVIVAVRRDARILPDSQAGLFRRRRSRLAQAHRSRLARDALAELYRLLAHRLLVAVTIQTLASLGDAGSSLDAESPSPGTVGLERRGRHSTCGEGRYVAMSAMGSLMA